MRSEMNTNLGPHPPASKSGDGNGKANYGVPISLEYRGAFDSIQQQGYQKFNDFYTRAVSVYIAGPANSNLGYWGEAQFPQQSPKADPTTHTYRLVGPNTDGGGATMSPWLRFYKGSPRNFLYGRVGNVSVDGFEGNNSSIMAAMSPSNLTSNINSSFMNGRGIEIGYNHNDNAVAGYLVEPNSDGYRTNKPSAVLQFLHFIGKHDSSVQAVFVDGSVPTDTSGDDWNNYSQLILYGNYRTPLRTGGAVNLLGGYANDHNHNTVKVNGQILENGGLGASGYFGELDYEHNAYFVPYARYDNFDTGDYLSGGKTKNGNTNAYTLGTAIMVDQDARLNLDWNHANSNASGIVNTVRAQLLFIF